ncbi:MAG: DUF5017 domain-containing protein [Candidatus Pedobacter colombiensis]|uniref:DUF5017 domain-containing protein n=1 Tax=Candidatus Pedobacter colombiensis TaxID=3121371 RepID=A0AAJ6B5D3_9SPHI|nr:DUF5017 domain-containing protein [Pedobacter sp.]WEK18060.1 MAG: DUF5017 domain-containing protein [Pedobacter sp.]
MNKLKYILGVLLLPVMVACQKSEPEKPTFNVNTAKQEYKVGEIVTFSISGYADLISFYSGEPGKEYRFKDRIESEDSKLKLRISTQALYGSQTNNLTFWYSTNFNDTYTVEGLKAATWKEITNRVKLSTYTGGSVGPIEQDSEVDISDLPVSNTPIYFAFKYEGWESATAALGGKTWRIHGFDLYNIATDGRRTDIATAKSPQWIAIDVVNPVNKWTFQNVAPFMIFAPNSTLLPSEDWAVSRAFLPNATKPDVGVGIKDYLKPMRDYKYTFTKEGKYTVTFVGKNVNNLGEEAVVKTLTIVVTK